MCMCAYHSHFIEAVAAFHKYVPSLPDYNNGFVGKLLCEDTSMDCYFGKCILCHGISSDSLKDFVAETQLDINVSWMVWKHIIPIKRVEKHSQNGSFSDPIAHISGLAPQFLKHSYIKREQCEIFNTYDRARATNADIHDEGLGTSN